jgi:hypothetical protein
MKKALFAGFILLQFIGSSFGQIYKPGGSLIFIDTLNLRPLDTLIAIQNPDSTIWQVCRPSKGRFDSAYSGQLALITDSVHMYSNNRNDCVYLSFPQANFSWGGAMISFYHKYETDTLIDGGILEISYNNGVDWLDVHDDTLHMTNYIGLYKSTIKGGYYGFSGSSGGWKYVELYWLWRELLKSSTYGFNEMPLIRFRFISDNINTHKEGWMISDIIIRVYSAFGAVPKLLADQVSVFPNPGYGPVFFDFPEKYSNTIKIEIYDILGRIVTTEFPDHGYIDFTNKRPGIYIFKLYNSNDLLYTGKLIKN